MMRILGLMLLLLTLGELTSLNAQSTRRNSYLDLNSIWIKADRYSVNGYHIARSCKKGSVGTECKAEIRRASRVVAKFESSIVLDYGLFGFLKGDKQLVIHTYSGGMHCCDT